MSRKSVLGQLRDLLAELYPTKEGSWLVVDDAGLSRGLISFRDAAKENWHHILDVAERHGRVGALVQVAEEEYPERASELEEAYKGFQAVPKKVEGVQEVGVEQEEDALRRTGTWWADLILLVAAMILLPLWYLLHLYPVVAGILTVGALGALAALFLGAWRLTTWLLGKQRARLIAHEALGSPKTTVLLALLWLTALGYVLSHSSVRIFWSPDTGLGSVRLVAAEDSSVLEERSFGKGLTKVTVPVATGWPWRARRQYEIQVEGYLPRRFHVPLLPGKTIRVDHDLEVSPTVMFRPPILALSSLQNGGRLCVWQVIPPGQRRPLGRMVGKRQAFLMGSERAIDPIMVEKWRGDLEETIEDHGRVRETIDEWTDPVKCRPPQALQAGMRLEAEVHTRAGYLEARVGPFLLEKKPFVDKLMMMEIARDHVERTKDCLLPDGDEPCAQSQS